MKKVSIFISILILIGFSYLYVIFNYEGFHGGGGRGGGGGREGGGRGDGGSYRGSGRWDSNRWGYGGDAGGWVGSWMYPVSINCNCPDNYDFKDNFCINRSYPFDAVAPFCYE